MSLCINGHLTIILLQHLLYFSGNIIKFFRLKYGTYRIIIYYIRPAVYSTIHFCFAIPPSKRHHGIPNIIFCFFFRNKMTPILVDMCIVKLQ